MLKRLKQYFRKRREIKLRKWCIEKAARVEDSYDVPIAAQRIYDWITMPPESTP